MKTLVFLSALITACLAAPGFLPGGVGSLKSAALDPFGCPGCPAIGSLKSAALDPFGCPGCPAIGSLKSAALDPFGCPGCPGVGSLKSAALDPYGCPGCKVAGLPTVSYAAAFPAVALTSQYHAQDELGQYSYGYQAGPSAKAETRAFDGSVSGGYSYVDANGVLQSAQYVSDPVYGFRVAATNLPAASARPVQDTAEVAQARAAHAAFVADAAARSAAASEARDQPQGAGPTSAPARAAAPTPAAATAAPASRSGAAQQPSGPTSYANIVIGPSGVPLDTPEVAAARAADAVAHLQAKAAFFG